jgi:hypothetical protein
VSNGFTADMSRFEINLINFVRKGDDFVSISDSCILVQATYIDKNLSTVLAYVHRYEFVSSLTVRTPTRICQPSYCAYTDMKLSAPLVYVHQ